MAVAELVAESVTKPLSVLADAMEQVRAWQSGCIRPYRTKKMRSAFYTSLFQHMTREMRTMIQTIYENRKNSASKSWALQAQIQPHFLYNTLDSIILRSLRMNQVKESIQMLDALTDFLDHTEQRKRYHFHGRRNPPRKQLPPDSSQTVLRKI